MKQAIANAAAAAAIVMTLATGLLAYAALNVWLATSVASMLGLL